MLNETDHWHICGGMIKVEELWGRDFDLWGQNFKIAGRWQVDGVKDSMGYGPQEVNVNKSWRLTA